MQDITSSKCSSMPIGTEGRLIDKRDNKIYWVARLRNATDNNALCWMTQNLDYDGGAAEGYNGDDIATLEPGTSFTTTTQSQKLYYDPGDYVYTSGSGANNCGSNLSSGLSECVSKGWIDVNGLLDTWTTTNEDYFMISTEYVGTDGQSICNKDAGSPFGDSKYSQCRIYYAGGGQYMHYLAGNYYNWAAATDGATVSSDGTSADTSICPTGWKLPLSGGGNTGNDGSFYKLMYGLKGTEITVAPYYFVYGGYVGNSTLNYAGSRGYYWSATVKSAGLAYHLDLNSNSVSPSSNNYRYSGYPVRCVAR